MPLFLDKGCFQFFLGVGKICGGSF
uniref:Uncharacterized protein n=1 Tax=Arundo donax TaxID=35708 RepID=A0A0A9GP33_ARUDO